MENFNSKFIFFRKLVVEVLKNRTKHAAEWNPEKWQKQREEEDVSHSMLSMLSSQYEVINFMERYVSRSERIANPTVFDHHNLKEAKGILEKLTKHERIRENKDVKTT